jgi:hypothetical protein
MSRDIITEGTLYIRKMTKPDFNSLISFITGIIQYQLTPFTLTADSLDLGLGVGVPITNCRFMKNTTQGIMTYKKPGLFEVAFPFRTNSVGGNQ